MTTKRSGLNWRTLVLKGWLFASLCCGYADRTPIESVESWGGSWSFDGFNDGINIAMDDNVEFLGGFTVDLRFRYSRRQPHSELFHLKLGGTVMSAYLLPGTYGLAVNFRGPDNSLYRHQFPFPGISDKWHHLTICLSRTTPAKAYFDGATVQAETDIEKSVQEIPTNHLHLGGTGNIENSRFAGDIDAVRFWNRMLGEEELTSIGIRNHPSTYPQKLVNWTFETNDLSQLATPFEVETKGNPTWVSPQKATQSKIIIHGTITNTEEVPLPMHRVELRSPKNKIASMMTDAKGEFILLIDREHQTIVLSANDKDTWTFSEPVKLSDLSLDSLDLSQIISKSPILEGFIRAKDLETPISGVEVMLENLDLPQTIGPVSSFSDLSGRYQFSGIPPGKYSIIPRPSKWSLFPDQQILFDDSNLSQSIQINKTPIGIDFNIQ